MKNNFIFIITILQTLLLILFGQQLSDCVQKFAGDCLDITKPHRNYRKFKKEIRQDKIDEDFQNEEITKQIVDLFHEWEKLPMDLTIHFENNKSYNTPHISLKNDLQYCQKSDIWKLQNPDSIFKNYYILSDFAPQELVREISKDFGVDVMPRIYMGMNENQANQRLNDIDIRTSLLNSRISRFHHFHPFGKAMFCTFQSSNHVPGKWAITGKDMVINNLRTYLLKPFQNPEQCQETVTFMPPSYRLYDKKECQDFFKYLESDEYKEKITKQKIAFILKKGRDIHRGEGINLFTPKTQQKFQTKYQNGEKCGIIKDVVQAQTYIANPMLYKKRKIEVRIYFFIASTNPLIIYSQNMAHLRMCGEDFDLFSTKKTVHVCNVAVSNANSKDKDYVVDFSLDGLRDYLIEEGKITNQNWVEQELYPQIYQAIIHLVRLGEHDLFKSSIVNENFAVDFLLDDNSKIWFMENNPNPQIMKISEKRVRRHYIMFGDMFEIEFNYLRSRFKRLQKLAKKMKNAIELGTLNNNIKEFKEQFKLADQNKLEEEFQLDQLNTYQKIYDENLPGKDKFMGFLPEGCLYNNNNNQNSNKNQKINNKNKREDL